MQYYARKILASACSLLAVFVLIAMLIWSNPIGESVKNGVNICLYTLIPSLFVFMSVSSFFLKTGLLKQVLFPFSWLCSKLFRVDISLGPLLFMSLTGGYPVGAKLISELVKQGALQKQEAERLLCYCVNAGPAFLIGAVAVPIYRSTTLGFVLFFSHVIAFFIIGTLTGIGKQPIKVKPKESKGDLAGALVDSVFSSIKAMSMICGFVLLFSAVIGLARFTNLLEAISSFPALLLGRQAGEALVTGLLEVVNGIQACEKVPGAMGFVMVAALTGFGGLSVHCQIKAIVLPGRISMKPFYRWKMVHIFVSSFCSYLFIKLSNSAVPAFMDYNGNRGSLFSFTPISSIFLIILAIMLLFNMKKSAKI